MSLTYKMVLAMVLTFVLNQLGLQLLEGEVDKYVNVLISVITGIVFLVQAGTALYGRYRAGGVTPTGQKVNDNTPRDHVSRVTINK